jgi:hypothetical protein
MNDSVFTAFDAYFDLCREGVCRYDRQILEQLWREFVRDMESGFASCFGEKGALNG